MVYGSLVCYLEVHYIKLNECSPGAEDRDLKGVPLAALPLGPGRFFLDFLTATIIYVRLCLSLPGTLFI